MNTPNQYLMLATENRWYERVSAEELQSAMAKFGAWFEELNQKGVIAPGAPLARAGAIITSKGGHITVADGPFAESKEAIGGYCTLTANSLEEAISYAKTFPGLEYGGTVEVRPIAGECPMQSRARQIAEPAFATA